MALRIQFKAKNTKLENKKYETKVSISFGIHLNQKDF
jgi:hypothetical protein